MSGLIDSFHILQQASINQPSVNVQSHNQIYGQFRTRTIWSDSLAYDDTRRLMIVVPTHSHVASVVLTYASGGVSLDDVVGVVLRGIHLQGAVGFLDVEVGLIGVDYVNRVAKSYALDQLVAGGDVVIPVKVGLGAPKILVVEIQLVFRTDIATVVWLNGLETVARIQ